MHGLSRSRAVSSSTPRRVGTVTDRRQFLSLALGGVVTLAGCADVDSGADVGSNTGSTPTATPPFEAAPEELLLTTEELPADVNWGDSRRSRSEETASASYEVLDEEGTVTHQVSLVLNRRLTVEGASLDHEHLVDTYREERDATVESLSLGEESSLVTFGDEAHVLVVVRNVSFNFGVYDGGPAEQVRTLAELQVEKLRANRS